MSTVLVYHTISSPPEPMLGDIDISPEQFEQQLRWLSRWRRVVPVEETLKRRGGVAISFDDGFRDNLTVALPILEKYKLPMTLFVASGFLGTRDYLSVPELREMSRHPLVTIGAHGLFHRHFNRLASEDARFELVESRRQLTAITGKAVDLLAWPFGECNEQLEQLSADAGFRAAWSVWKGANGRHSRWRVPLGRNDTFPRFIAKTSGVYALTKARWHRAAAGRDETTSATGTGRSVFAE